MSADIFGWHNLAGCGGGVELVASSGQRPEVLLNILQMSEHPYNKKFSGPKRQLCQDWEALCYRTNSIKKQKGRIELEQKMYYSLIYNEYDHLLNT